MNTEIIKIDRNESCLEEKLTNAAAVIKNGGLVVFPTETVYGLGADAMNEEAVASIYEAKGRPSDNPLIIHIARPEDAEKYAYTTELYKRLSNAFMPGPITVIMKAKSSVPLRTRGGLDTVALRCPSDSIANKLIILSGTGIAAPSANLSGTPSATNASHVIEDMSGRVHMIIDGGTSDFGLESTIVKIEDENTVTLLRPGRITVDDFKKIGCQVKIADAVTDKLPENARPLSPGMKYRHYAPKADLILLDGDIQQITEYILRQKHKKYAVICYTEDMEKLEKILPSAVLYNFGHHDLEEEQAAALFSVLREADKCSFEIIYAPLPKAEGIGLALYNRMIRAAAHKIIKL